MSTPHPVDTHLPPQTSQTGRRRPGPRDVLQFVYLVAAVILVALLGLIAFGLLFNRATVLLWMFVAGLFVFRQGFIEYRNHRAVSGTATAKANAAAIGLAELCGRGYAAVASEAPVTQTRSVYWKVEVHQWQARSKHRGWHRKLRQLRQVDTLEFEDETGRVPVWTRGAEIIPIKHVWRSQDGNPPDAGLRLVAAIGLQWPPPSSRYPMKITEERIEQGGPLYVMGTLSERRQIPAAPSGFVPALLDKWLKASPRLEGQSFADAFRFAGQGARRCLARDLQPLSRLWSPPNLDDHQVLVWKGEQRRPFIIAGMLEREALRALSRRAWLSIFVGAALMAGTLWVGLLKLTHVIR
jgi:hypothetical protein